MTASFEAVERQEQITQSLSRVSASNSLHKITAERALITAPFGQKYFDECIRHFSTSKALRCLSSKNNVPVLVVTSKQTKIRPVPGLQIIQIDPIPGWPAHDSYQSRFIKWGIPFLFPNIRQSIYADSDLRITDSSEKLMRLFDRVEQKRCVITKHETRSGWEEEYREILKAKRIMDAGGMEDQRRVYQKEGLPGEAAVFQTNVIGRAHGSEFDALSAGVLSQLLQYCERDQLALPFAILKSGINPYAANEGEFLYSGFKNSFNADTLCFVDGMVAGKFLLSRCGFTFCNLWEPGFLEKAMNKICRVLGSPSF